MSRLTFLLMCVVGFGGIALSLFVVENEVDSLKRDLSEIERQIHADKEAIHVLKAEWAYLTRPQRVAMLSKKYLELEPVKSAQFVGLKELRALPVRENEKAELALGITQ